MALPTFANPKFAASQKQKKLHPLLTTRAVAHFYAILSGQQSH
jgi:hypothetical protein